VILFSAADPLRWAPLDEARHIALGGIPGEQDFPHAAGEPPHRYPTEELFPAFDEVIAALDELRRRWPRDVDVAAVGRSGG
jgi:hypothetical protein